MPPRLSFTTILYYLRQRRRAFSHGGRKTSRTIFMSSHVFMLTSMSSMISFSVFMLTSFMSSMGPAEVGSTAVAAQAPRRLTVNGTAFQGAVLLLPPASFLFKSSLSSLHSAGFGRFGRYEKAETKASIFFWSSFLHGVRPRQLFCC